ncbi:MAG TPA: TetR/AcrR family transcriptional regulator [Micromonosporaceae bacterium]|nr:TetR/AcrR family transcriptional regulator [Micromonosporaceae bacterium]
MSSGGKGAQTRDAALEQAVEIAARVGLTGLTIGSLAERMGMSKSGLFAHFRSKEALQMQVLEHARERFTDQVVRPALRTPRGEPRVRRLFEGWLACAREGATGYLFVTAPAEYDDQPGLVRDQLAGDHCDLMDSIAQIVRSGMREGHFRADTDPDQFANDLHGVMLAYIYAHRLLRQPEAEARARRAFETLLGAIRA